MAGSGSWQEAEVLMDVARADTAYADLYLQRARELVGAELTEAQYAALADQDAEVVNLTNRIANAMEVGDWQVVRDLTGRLSAVERNVAERAPVRSAAARAYAAPEVLVDPFSPGICGLAGVQERDLPAQRDAAVRRLERLRGSDPAWADLYEARREALAGLQLAAATVATKDAAPSLAALRARAQKALADRDLAQLQQLSAQIMAEETKEASSGDGEAAAHAAGGEPDLTQPFARDVCDRAGKLGLAPYRVESTAERVRATFKPAWRPTLGGEAAGTTVRLSASVPSDTPEALRDTIQLLMNRPFVTSAGTRYMPRFVAEDVLVEEFDDPPPGSKPRSPLVEALGLPGSGGLSRKRIEAAIRARGAGIVRDVGLDPRAYRIACIPVDVYTRLGIARGWGQQETWTHFDGYMASKDRKLMALVGGDVRFGGRHDLVAVGADYDSDRLFARLAIVQRRRFATW